MCIPYIQGSKVIVYSTEGDQLNAVHEFSVQDEVNSIAYNPSGDRIAVTGAARTVFIYDTDTYKVRMYMHSDYN